MFLTTPWWERRQAPWHFWIDPWGEVRVSHAKRYYYTHPAPVHAGALTNAGWTVQPGNPDGFYTDDQILAKESLESLGLATPEWGGKHCYRVYWHEMNYYI